MTENIEVQYYTAPEIFDGNYGKEIDNWALGVILYELLSGTRPFFGQNSEELVNSIKKGSYSFTKAFLNCSIEVIYLFV